MGVRRRLLIPPIDQVRPRFHVCADPLRESGIAAAEKSSAAIPKGQQRDGEVIYNLVEVSGADQL